MLDKSIKSLLLITFLFISFSVLSQIRTSSPLSRYGMGINQNRGFVDNRSMGNAGIGLRNEKHVNFLNAASYSAIDSLTFIFETGISSNFYKFIDDGTEASSVNNDLEYLGLSFRFTKWWATALGVMPYSKIGYKLRNEDLINTYDNEAGQVQEFVQYQFSGDGGYDQLVWGHAITPVKWISVGVNAAYIFGLASYASQSDFYARVPYYNIVTVTKDKVEYSDTLGIKYKKEYSIYPYSTIKENSRSIQGFYFDFGMQLHYDFDNKSNVTFGLIYSPEQSLTTKENEQVAGISYSTGEVNAQTENDTTGSFIIPSKFGIGVSYSKLNKLTVCADFSTQNWQDTKTVNSASSFFKKETAVGGGIAYTPNIYTPKGYFKRITYKLGMSYKNMNIQLVDPENGSFEPVKDFGISFGMELPLKRSKNSLSISANLGQKSTGNATIIKEQYLFLNLNLTLNETWFYKSKIN